MDNTYDSKLLMYQALLSIPTEVLMLEIYDKIDQKDTNTYAAMSLLNIGSYFATLGLAKAYTILYIKIHLLTRPLLKIIICPLLRATYTTNKQSRMKVLQSLKRENCKTN